MLVPISWHILLEEPHKFLQFLLLLLGKVAVHKDDAPVGKTIHAIAVLPKTNVEFYRLDNKRYIRSHQHMTCCLPHW